MAQRFTGVVTITFGVTGHPASEQGISTISVTIAAGAVQIGVDPHSLYNGQCSIVH